MENNQDIRWIQRYDNYHRACSRVLEITESNRAASSLSELEKEGLIQRFEYTFELAWKVLQDLMHFRGYEFTPGPNGALQMALEDGIIASQDSWRQMMKARNLVSHTYDEEDASEIVDRIYSEFSPLLKQLDENLNKEAKKCMD